MPEHTETRLLAPSNGRGLSIPSVPVTWDFEESVSRVRQVVYRWKNLTAELAEELYIAREALSTGGRSRNGEHTWNEYCVAVGVTRQTANGWLRRWFPESGKNIPLLESTAVPAGLFACIVIDPPWAYGSRAFDASHRARNPYSAMAVEDIKALTIPSADDCVLWLWTTNAFMHEAYHVLEEWGFTPKTILTWAKDRMGLGDWLRGQTEHCVMAVKGSPRVHLTNQTTILHGPMREHSRKPDEFFELVEALCDGPRLEMFARQRRENWEVHGNEPDKFA